MDGLPAVQLIANRFTMQDQRIKDQEEEAFRVLSAEIEANIAHEEATIGFSSSFSLSFSFCLLAADLSKELRHVRQLRRHKIECESLATKANDLPATRSTQEKERHWLERRERTRESVEKTKEQLQRKKRQFAHVMRLLQNLVEEGEEEEEIGRRRKEEEEEEEEEEKEEGQQQTKKKRRRGGERGGGQGREKRRR